VEVKVEHVSLVVVEEAVENAMGNQVISSAKLAERGPTAEDAFDDWDAEDQKEKVDHPVDLPFAHPAG
jgi:hypothetical protein